MALELIEPDVILLAHHDVQGNLAVRRLQVRQLVAELLRVEGLGLHRATGGTPARGFGVVVGVVGHPVELQRGVRENEREHLRPAIEVGIDLLARNDVADDAVEVLAGGLGSIGLASLLEDLIVGDPDATAGAGSRSTEVGGLFDQYGAQPVVCRGERRNHAGTTTPDDDDVVLLLSHVEHVIELRRPGATGAGLWFHHPDTVMLR
ncbi:Uncharacterised protein [Mycobacteroides abscessus subsp. abscessus]|nr:Uncharacterised protein [Mycobacteroides abscessus subsp. abscessus]